MTTHKQQTVIGVLAERAASERRVALIPADIKKLIATPISSSINERFVAADVAIVVGANDVVNPAARTNPASPIFGMPILKVEDAKSVLVLKRGKGKGFSGVENNLFVDPKTSMLFGDARQSLLDLALQVKVA
jgi:NAD/NADP transhydrogenase beta subunit